MSEYTIEYTDSTTRPAHHRAPSSTSTTSSDQAQNYFATGSSSAPASHPFIYPPPPTPAEYFTQTQLNRTYSLRKPLPQPPASQTAFNSPISSHRSLPRSSASPLNALSPVISSLDKGKGREFDDSAEEKRAYARALGLDDLDSPTETDENRVSLNSPVDPPIYINRDPDTRELGQVDDKTRIVNNESEKAAAEVERVFEAIREETLRELVREELTEKQRITAELRHQAEEEAAAAVRSQQAQIAKELEELQLEREDETRRSEEAPATETNVNFAATAPGAGETMYPIDDKRQHMYDENDSAADSDESTAVPSYELPNEVSGNQPEISPRPDFPAAYSMPTTTISATVSPISSPGYIVYGTPQSYFATYTGNPIAPAPTSYLPAQASESEQATLPISHPRSRSNTDSSSNRFSANGAQDFLSTAALYAGRATNSASRRENFDSTQQNRSASNAPANFYNTGVANTLRKDSAASPWAKPPTLTRQTSSNSLNVPPENPSTRVASPALESVSLSRRPSMASWQTSASIPAHAANFAPFQGNLPPPPARHQGYMTLPNPNFNLGQPVYNMMPQHGQMYNRSMSASPMNQFQPQPNFNLMTPRPHSASSGREQLRNPVNMTRENSVSSGSSRRGSGTLSRIWGRKKREFPLQNQEQQNFQTGSPEIREEPEQEPNGLGLLWSQL